MKMTHSLILSAVLSVFSAIALADTGHFAVSGMHCGDCAKSVAAKVCKIEGVEKCDVKVGSVDLTTKAGFSIDAKKVEELVTAAGDEYKVTKSEVMKSSSAGAQPTKTEVKNPEQKK